MNSSDFDEDGLPNRAGIYLVQGIWGDDDNDEPREIDVYRHPIKGLCCFQEDFGSCGTGIDDRYDRHVSVQNTGLKFIKKVRGKNEPPSNRRR